ncbi:MAG: LolA-related protein [Acidiphilium sp.]
MRLGALLWLCVMVCAAPAAIAQPAPTAWGLPQLMHALARVKSASARFTERKTMHMLNAPLVTSGTLEYIAPDRVRKTTASPVPERFVLDGNRVTIVGPDNRTHTFSLSDYPQIGGLVEGIRATLAGDLPTLDRFYFVRLTGNSAHWQLLLRPRGAVLTHFIRWIRIGGEGNRIDAIDTESSDGDHSEMSIAETVVDAR